MAKLRIRDELKQVQILLAIVAEEPFSVEVRARRLSEIDDKLSTVIKRLNVLQAEIAELRIKL